MSPRERYLAAWARVVKADPAYAMVIELMLIGIEIIGLMLWLCISFGAMSVSGLSLWWGVPAALVGRLVYGRLSWWLTGEKRAKAAEAMANKVERGGK